MKIVFIGDKNLQENDEIINGLKDLGQEITLRSGNIFTLFFIPFNFRTGDVYFYSQKETPTLVMRFVQKLLNKPVVPLEKMPPLRPPKADFVGQAIKSVLAFEKRCYREYDKYFSSKVDKNRRLN